MWPEIDSVSKFKKADGDILNSFLILPAIQAIAFFDYAYASVRFYPISPNPNYNGLGTETLTLTLTLSDVI